MATRMTGKKGTAKAKGKEAEPATTASDVWRPSKCSEADLKRLVDDGLLQPKETIQWRPATGDKRLLDEAEEIVVFQHCVKRVLALPTSNFFRGLLYYYGLQLHHLNPNSILHISIFVHFCEAYLGIEPHFDLFCYLFHVKPQPNEKKMFEVGGAGIKLRQWMKKKCIPYKFPTSLSGWREHWFYIGNYKPSLPERTAGTLKLRGEWTMSCRDRSQIEDLLDMIKERTYVGVNAVTVMYSWIGRRIQPLQKHDHFGFEYLGLSGLSRFSVERIQTDEAVLRVDPSTYGR
jgi:hypothetical protein